MVLPLLLLLGCCAASVPSLDGVDMEAWERQLELEYSQLQQRFHSEWRKTKGSDLQALQPTSREHKWYLCTSIRTLLHRLLVADAGYFTLKWPAPITRPPTPLSHCEQQWPVSQRCWRWRSAWCIWAVEVWRQGHRMLAKIQLGQGHFEAASRSLQQMIQLSPEK